MFANRLQNYIKNIETPMLFPNNLLSLWQNCRLMQETKMISAYKQGLKGRILETAMRAFAEKGIRAVKMDDVASKLSISKRTLYEIYATKEDMLFEGLKKYHEESHQRMDMLSQQSNNVMEIVLKVYQMKVEEFQMTNAQFYSDLVKYPRVLRYLNRENQRMRTSYIKFLDRGVMEGFFRDDINYELVSRMFDALGRYIMAQQLYKQYPMQDILNNFVFVSLRGLCTEKGTKVLDHLF